HYEVMGERFDGLVVALQGWRAAALVSDFGAELAQALAAIPFGSGAIVTFGLDESQLDKPLDAAGFVVPAAEGREIMASTYSSAKWAGRAPAGKALLRAFLGGHTHGHVAEWDDARLQAVAWRNLRELVGIRGEPELVRVDRWRRVMPRYHVDHLRRIEAIERMVSEYPAFSLAGNSYRGVGIPDSIRSGQRAADQVFAAAG
ncbi:MAG: protoporphyrinogen oxidase, partial [Myxococcota bacterium]